MKFIRVIKCSIFDDLRNEINNIWVIDDYEIRKIFFKNISKKIVRNLNKLFTLEGLEKQQEVATGVRGFHRIQRDGYHIDVNYSFWPEHIVISSYKDGYINKIKNILDKENIKYNYNAGDIIIDLDKQF